MGVIVSSETGGTSGSGVITDAAIMREVEAIKVLKARYCRYLDAKDWGRWRSIFADDFVGDTSESGGEIITGADAFVAYTQRHLGKRSRGTVHQVHAPEIELTSATTATGVWALQDVVRIGLGLNLLGYGHYHENYVKVAGRWYLGRSKLTRLREDIFNPFFSLRISPSLRDAGSALARRRST